MRSGCHHGFEFGVFVPGRRHRLHSVDRFGYSPSWVKEMLACSAHARAITIPFLADNDSCMTQSHNGPIGPMHSQSLCNIHTDVYMHALIPSVQMRVLCAMDGSNCFSDD